MSRKLKWGTRAKIKLADLAGEEFEPIETDKGTLYLVDADSPAEGVEVFVLDGEEVRVMPEDGVYLWDSQNLTVENGVIITVEDGANNNTEGMDKEKLKKVSKVKADAGLADVIMVVDSLVDVVNEIIEEVELITGDTIPSPEELSNMNERLSKVEKSASEFSSSMKDVEDTVGKTLEKLSEVSKKSNGSFANPNPDPDKDIKKQKSTKDYFAEINKR